MSDVQLFKLMSGEEIVAKVKSQGTDTTVIENPIVLIYQQMDGGRMNVGFAPFMPYSEGSVTLNNSSITASAQPKDQILQEYNRIFSNIIIAPANVML